MLRGVILAGGTGSRMADLMTVEGVANKHLLPVGGGKMIDVAVCKLRAAGIADILVVTSRDGVGPLGKWLGSSGGLPCRLSYRVQDEPGGIAHALSLAEDFAHGGSVAVVLADNVWHAPFPAAFFAAATGYAWIALAPVPDPQRYGVATLDRTTRRIVTIEEKPRDPLSNLAVTGIYAYPEGVFNRIRQLKPSARGELEITELNQLYLSAGKLEYVTLPGWWIDAGTPEGLAEADRLCREQPPLW